MLQERFHTAEIGTNNMNIGERMFKWFRCFFFSSWFSCISFIAYRHAVLFRIGKGQEL